MSYVIKEMGRCERPLLRHVECAIVLTMADSTRLDRPEARALHTICRRTFVQINPGAHAGKPEWVRTSVNDIVHAYKNACAFAVSMENVLILEDDAQLMEGATAEDFARVDAFVGNNPSFNAYSLGMFGATYPVSLYHRRILTGLRWPKPGGAQAVIWSPGLRRRLIETGGASIGHLDAGFIGESPPVYVYRAPLVVQLFPATENQKNWVFFRRNVDDRSPWACAADRAIHRWMTLLQLDRRTVAWNWIYSAQALLMPAILLVAASSLACTPRAVRAVSARVRHQVEPSRLGADCGRSPDLA